MLDFLIISTRFPKKGLVEIYPKFIIPTQKSSSDLMIRGSDFYAIWNEDSKLWSTDETVALYLIDRELDKYAEEHKGEYDEASNVKILHMWDADNGMIDKWHKYITKQMRDHYHPLDEQVIFSNTELKKSTYASRTLPYPLEPGEIRAYDEMMSVLYSPDERRKIEWAVGSIVAGESKYIQKFLVLYGAPGTGKSTVLNIILKMFDGYCSAFDAKALGSSSNMFALEAFKSNPLVAIQQDGDLSRIEDNTRLNSIVSHELMSVNEKFKSTYMNRFNSFLFMGTNKPVKISDAKSGILRRLIDVSPTGNKLPLSKYKALNNQINFELGAIAWHCKQVYEADPGYYDSYIPTSMMGASNDFYNYVLDNYDTFKREDQVTLKVAWERYRVYCEEAKVLYPYSMRNFKEELKNYFKEYYERITLEEERVRSLYKGFIFEKFENQEDSKDIFDSWIVLKQQGSLFDKYCAECPAQLANESGTPSVRWAEVETKLSDIDTTKLHYVQVPTNHIVIDFDIKNEKGEKDYVMNLKEASKWPKTYAELSKGGSGLHLHYIYSGDPSKLSSKYGDDIEVKVFTGNSSLRRKLSRCNDIPIATIGSGLPLKEEKNVVGSKTIKSERSLRKQIVTNLNKEIHPATKPSVDFIFKILDDAYNSDLKYDVSDMRPAVLAFAANSTNHSDYCIALVNKMHFKSEDQALNNENYRKDELVFYDVEVFPNLFLVNWKIQGPNHKVVRMINPSPEEIERLIRMRLIGFNCRRYDNHILYARIMGYTNEQLFKLSKQIIETGTGFFGEAYNISYTDVYDFSSKKQSLKKFEIDLGIHHQELGLPWDQPVPEDLWIKVAEYCDNDVIATEAVFESRKGDWTARQILADLAGMTVNDTTNQLTARVIFGSNRSPQSEFNYRFLGEVPGGWSSGFDPDPDPVGIKVDPNYTIFVKGKPVFPGYIFEAGKSTYRGEEVGEGGYVYAEKGIYHNVALLDIASMHPSSAIAEQVFGERYTKNFADLKQARLYIKHGELDKAKKILDGKLAKYLDDPTVAKDLTQALKIAINAVYGLTSAKFPNVFKDPRNIDNIVAKRGALFMINLKHEVQARGFTVAHIKTDSIKIPNATKEIIQFVMDYGKLYGYDFEHEATYDRMCLVNDAVYIAKYKDGDWTATGAQFQVPYVFKTLFSHEPVVFDDFCEAKSVSKGDIYLDYNEGLPEGEHNYCFVGRVGLFTPLMKGAGGGELYRYANDKYYSVTGTKGYRWQESELVKALEKEDCIDISYYDKLVNAAIAAINEFGDFKEFIK